MKGYVMLCYDRVYCQYAGQEYWLLRDTLDSELPKHMLDAVQKQQIVDWIIITGPWWFTNLRVWSLVCNLLRHYMPSIQFSSISKLDIYTWAVDQWYLPAQGLIYIGQKKTVRYYDFGTKTYSLVPKDQQLPTDCFVDGIQGYFPVDYSNQQAVFTIDQGMFQIQYQWSYYDCNPLLSQLEPVQTVVPAYYVQPVIG